MVLSLHFYICVGNVLKKLLFYFFFFYSCFKYLLKSNFITEYKRPLPLISLHPYSTLNYSLSFHPGVTVYQPMYLLNQSEIVIMFSSGAGIEVVENKGFMSARVYLPWNYMVSRYSLSTTLSRTNSTNFSATVAAFGSQSQSAKNTTIFVHWGLSSITIKWGVGGL